MQTSFDLFANLTKFDTPTISNMIELFDVVPRNRGYMDGRIRAAFPELPPMVGFAATAAFRSEAPPAGGDAYGSMDEQVALFAELPGPAIVVFQDLDDPAIAATFGEVMCSTYRGFGSVGPNYVRVPGAISGTGSRDQVSRYLPAERFARTPIAISCTSGCRCTSAD